MGEPAVPAPGSERRMAMGEVVFEAGQVVRFRAMSKQICVVTDAYGKTLHCSPVNDSGSFAEHAQWFDPVSPAPRHGDTWTSGESVVQICRNGPDSSVDRLRIVSKGDPFVGDVVAVARKLWECGYRRVSDTCVGCVEAENTGGAWSGHSCGAANMEINNGPTGDIRPMPSLASAVAEIFTTPTREASRRYVDMAVKALGYEPFAKAVQATLVSLVGDRISVFPTPNEIMATVDACHAWEQARGQVAPAKRTLGKAETWELTEVAKLAAWARVSMRDASDIGEIVAEAYERARATC